MSITGKDFRSGSNMSTFFLSKRSSCPQVQNRKAIPKAAQQITQLHSTGCSLLFYMTDNGFAKEGRSRRARPVSLTKDKNSCILDGLTNPNTHFSSTIC